MIQVSDRALKKIQNILVEENVDGQNLRVGVKGGGCSGFSYVMKFEENTSEADQVFSFNDVKIVVDSKSLVYLAGTEIDFTDGLNGSGFVFNNPNAARSCGCGSSFGV